MDWCASRDRRSSCEQGAQFSHVFLRELELIVGKGRTYRGRVISLEGQGHIDPRGGGSTVKVHRLAEVDRHNVILPSKNSCRSRPQHHWIHDHAGTTQDPSRSGKQGTPVLRTTRDRQKPTPFAISLGNSKTIRRCWLRRNRSPCLESISGWRVFCSHP